MIDKKEFSGKNESGKWALIRNVKFTRSSMNLVLLGFGLLYRNVEVTNVKLITNIFRMKYELVMIDMY